MKKSYYKGYWMVTNRCNLNCSYCVLEDSSEQIKRELDLESKKEMITHLYNLGFRRLTLSGGEILIIGRRPPEDFIELLNHIRRFRSDDPTKNLEIEIYTNGTFLDDHVAEKMQGIVDLVAVTIDSNDNNFLTQIGRNNSRFNTYYQNIIKVCQRLSRFGIPIKLHSVVGQKNHLSLPFEVSKILDDLEEKESKIICWKFYQYMSYDSPNCDQKHAIDSSTYELFCRETKKQLQGHKIFLHFKDNDEMNSSLFNILSYGNAQYMRKNDTWSTSPRTNDLRTYPTMTELFNQHDIDEESFRKFHEILK